MSYQERKMYDRLLISEIAKYKEMYDSKHAHFKDRYHKEQLWKQISSVVRRPVPECQLRWKSIRDGYVKFRRNPQMKGKPFRYNSQMSFIVPFIHFRSGSDKAANYFRETNDDDSVGDVSMLHSIQKASKNDTDDETSDETAAELENAEAALEEYYTNLGPRDCYNKPSDESASSDVEHKVNVQQLIALTAASTAPSKVTADRAAGVRRVPSVHSANADGTPTGSASFADAFQKVPCEEDDEDRLFMLSMVPALKRLAPQQRSATKIRVLQIFHDAMFPFTSAGSVNPGPAVPQQLFRCSAPMNNGASSASSDAQTFI